jgi:hypothetical protein
MIDHFIISKAIVKGIVSLPPYLFSYSLTYGVLSIFDVLILPIFHFLKQIEHYAFIPAVFMGNSGNGEMVLGLPQIAYGVGGENPLQAPGFKVKNADIEYVIPPKPGYFDFYPVAFIVNEFKVEGQVFDKNVKVRSEKVDDPGVYQLVIVYEDFVYLGLVHTLNNRPKDTGYQGFVNRMRPRFQEAIPSVSFMAVSNSRE